MEKYLEAADTALDVAIANRPAAAGGQEALQPQGRARRSKSTTESVYRKRDDTVVLLQFVGVERGHASASSTRRTAAATASASPPPAVQSGGKPVTFRVDAGPMRMADEEPPRRLLRRPGRQADRDRVRRVTWSRGRTIRILPYGLAGAQTVHKIGADKYDGPGLAVQWVEVEGPLHDTWPPDEPPPASSATWRRSRRRSTTTASASRSSRRTPRPTPRRILRDFARRAFRRAVTDADVKPFVALVKAKLAEKQSFEQAVRVGLTAVLVSPEFLFLREKPGKLDDFALASRLSYFLWSTMPDEELLALAEQRQARATRTTLRGAGRADAQGPEGGGVHRELRRPVARPARDRRHRAEPPPLPRVRRTCSRSSMVRETELFFDEVLKDDLSLTNFVASDFTMLNGRLAKHYGIPGVDGWEFRKVTLPPDSHRGGVLTMASVLKVTANGTTTSPVMRGAWVLDRILGTPPPQPPAGRAGRRAGHPRGDDDPRAARQAPAGRRRARAATRRSTRRASRWRAST